MAVEFLKDVYREHESDPALIFRDRPTTYGELLDAIARAETSLAVAGIGSGAVVALEGDYSPETIAHLHALFARGAIVVPLGPTSLANHAAFLEIAQVEWRIRLDDLEHSTIAATGRAAQHPLYARLRADGHPGLVLFTSGSEGEPKAALHDAVRLLAKYRTRRHRVRTLLFLLFDHIGGFDTLLGVLSNAGTGVIPDDRSPGGVSATLARHRVEVLPASPSFLALLLLGESHRRHDLSALRFVTYGAEVMPEATLHKLAAAFPGVTLLQKYGLTELGTLRSRSNVNDSTWVVVGGEGFETRIADGLLEIKAASSMLGYLNAPSPFTPDGWFMTGDAVEQKGDEIRILGRASDLINVGGQKVFPAEVEGAILEVSNMREAAVSGERHPFTGQIVVARVRLFEPESAVAVEQRVREHCRARLAAYKVPIKVLVVDEPLHTERSKTVRR